MRTVMAILAGILLAGCQASGGGREPIPLSEVPANVMSVAKEKLPEVTFDKAWQKKNGDYEVSGKDKRGKVREIDLTADGVVTEVE